VLFFRGCYSRSLININETILHTNIQDFLDKVDKSYFSINVAHDHVLVNIKYGLISFYLFIHIRVIFKSTPPLFFFLKLMKIFLPISTKEILQLTSIEKLTKNQQNIKSQIDQCQQK